MKNTKYSTLITLLATMAKYDSYWATMTQKRMLILLAKYHGIEINRRMLNYHLADLRKAGLIKTIKRHTRDEKGQVSLSPSAHCITLKGYSYLASKAVAIAWKRLKELRRKYFPDKTLSQILHNGSMATQEISKPPKYNPFLDPFFRQQHGMKNAFGQLKPGTEPAK